MIVQVKKRAWNNALFYLKIYKIFRKNIKIIWNSKYISGNSLGYGKIYKNLTFVISIYAVLKSIYKFIYNYEKS